MNVKDDDLICPISLCRFTHPLVLDCGHTIDKISFDKLPNKKNCPVCNVVNNSTKRVNWAIVEFLKLDLGQPPKPKLKNRITAKEAANLFSAQARSYAENLIDTEITEKIIQRIGIRKKDLEYPIDDAEVRNELISILQNVLGYTVIYDSTKITIKW